jgi:hypothetical protein
LAVDGGASKVEKGMDTHETNTERLRHFVTNLNGSVKGLDKGLLHPGFCLQFLHDDGQDGHPRRCHHDPREDYLRDADPGCGSAVHHGVAWTRKGGTSNNALCLPVFTGMDWYQE